MEKLGVRRQLPRSINTSIIKRKNNYLWTVTVGQHKVNTLSLFISQRDCGDKSTPVPHAKYCDVEVLSTFVFIDTSLSIVF